LRLISTTADRLWSATFDAQDRPDDFTALDGEA
jgi:hypothetical protein